MGKVINTTPQQLSQEDYDAKLEKNVNLMLDKGAPEEDVKAYVKDFSTRFSVKKKRRIQCYTSSSKFGIEWGYGKYFFGFTQNS